MAKSQLLYAAYDTGPSNYGLDIIYGAQRKKNWAVSYLGNNVFCGVFNLMHLPFFDYAIVGGPSSFENGLENAVLEKGGSTKSLVYVLGDSPGSILRPGVKEHVNHAIAIVALPSDVSKAKEFGYKDAVWLEGYPSHWGADPSKVKPSDIFTRGEYPEASIRIFVCGLKHAEITDNMLAYVTDIMARHGGDYCIYFQAHPSEMEITKDAGRRAMMLAPRHVVEITTRESVASLMMAADVTVCSGGATAIVEGALLRLPVVYYTDSQVMAYMKKMSNEEVPSAVTAGACEKMFPNMMGFVLQRLLDISNCLNSF